MNSKLPLIMTLCLGLNALACGSSAKNDAPNQASDDANLLVPTAKQANVGIELSSELSTEIQTLLKQDFKVIEQFDASVSSSYDNEMKSILGTSALDAGALKAWLNERISFMVPGDQSAYKLQVVFPQQKQIATLQLQKQKTENTIAATNIGAGFYAMTEEQTRQIGNPQYLRFQFNGRWIDILSPRVGLMQIGPALFSLAISPNKPASFASSAGRIQIIFHEARHSDGRKERENLAFYHVICSENSGAPRELVGKYACDDSTNGAYSVSYTMGRAYAKKCGEKCSESEKKMLEAIYADSFSRIVPAQGRTKADKDTLPEPGFKAAKIDDFQIIR